MSKNTNLSFLTDYITADITNGRIGINNASPTVAFDVVGATKITGVLTLTSTISNGTYAYTLPSATGTLALTSALSGYLPLTGGTLTGALTGTSAIFSSSVTATGNVTARSRLAITKADNTLGASIDYDDAINQCYIYNHKTGGYFSVYTNAVERLQIASTGAATFSSSVTMGGDLYLSATDGKIFGGTTTGRAVIGNSNLSTYSIWYGTTNATPNITTFVNNSALTLTLNANNTATFSSSVTANAELTLSSTGTAFVLLNNTTATTGKQWRLSSSSNGSFFITQPSVADVLTLAPTTGAATFSSSVTAGGVLNVQPSTYNRVQTYFSGTYTSGVQFSDLLGGITHSAANDQLNLHSNAAGGFISLTTNSSERLRVTSSGNVGIGTSSPSSYGNLTVVMPNSSNGTGIVIKAINDGGTASQPALTFLNGSSATIAQIIADNGTGYLAFNTGSTSTERMRITSGGLFKLQNNGSSYESSTAGVNEFNTNANDTNVVFRNTASSLTAARAGVDVFFANAAPNNTGSSFYSAADNTGTRTLRFEVRSNGGIANYSANNVSLSDERTKKDIIPLESYWDKFKSIEMVKFKYKDQTHDDYNIGVIAQQVEQVAPEFVDVDGWGETPEDGIPLKSIYTADLYHATIKVLQEAMVKIENQQSQIEELKTLLKA